jgi:hypothetical protein
MELTRFRTSIVKTTGTISLVLLGAVGLAGVSHADDIDCPPELGAVTVDGNVLIAAACIMDGTTVTGNILPITWTSWNHR